ncbi:MAG: FAD-binding protein, partial [Coriobacteriales bacterium]|nr:FAD-binding protein [Coriobacteriales bacterium]
QASLEMSQPDGRTYVCFDAKGYDLCMADAFEERVCRWVGENPHGDFAEMPEAQRWYSTMQYAIENGGIKMADTIEELEAQLGLEPGILVDNVARWNEACEKGEDYMVAFKYPPQWLNPIDTPPYYGAVVGGNPFGTKCGLMIDPKMRVMGTNGKPIPGLYAGWHTAGGSSGENNYGGRPGTGIYGDGALSYIGGYMVAGSIIAEDGREG